VVHTSHPTVYHSVILQLSVTLLHYFNLHTYLNIGFIRLNIFLGVTSRGWNVTCMYVCARSSHVSMIHCTAQTVSQQFLSGTCIVSSCCSTAQHRLLLFTASCLLVPQTSPQRCKRQCVVLPVDSHIRPLSATAGRCSPSAAPNGVLIGFRSRD